MSATLLFRWITFLLTAGFCIRIALFSDYAPFGGPFRYLAVWALFFSFFSVSRLIAIMERRSARRWDAVISMAAVVNVLVLFLFWRSAARDPNLMQLGRDIGPYVDLIYLSVVGPCLQIIDAVFVHRAFRGPKRGFPLLIGVLALYVLWIEAAVRPFGDVPFGRVTSGLPYAFLNDLSLMERAVLYAITLGIAVLLMVAFALISAKMRRLMVRSRTRPSQGGARATPGR